MHHVPKTAPSDLYVSGEYLAKNPNWHVEESEWKAKLILRMLHRNQLSPSSIIDIGCGAGEVLKQLQPNLDCNCALWGFEISPQAFELCRIRANEKLKFKLVDIRHEQDTFADVILLLDVIEHLQDYFGFLRDVRSKGRYTILHIPLDLSVQTVFRRYGLLKRRDMYAHLHYFTKDTALRTLEDLGYKIIDHFYTARTAEFGTELTQRLINLLQRPLFAIHEDFAVRMLGGYSLLVLAK